MGETLTASYSIFSDDDGINPGILRWNRNGNPIIAGGDLRSGENDVMGMAGSRSSAVSPDGYQPIGMWEAIRMEHFLVPEPGILTTWSALQYGGTLLPKG